jgi:ABC-type Fe3+/spermidine/putrescine transport system ATPase subunit
VYRHPNSAWVARFLGLTNLVPGEVTAHDPLRIDTPLGRLTLTRQEQLPIGAAVTLLLRPRAARFGGEHPKPAAGPALEGTVDACSFRGGHYRVTIQTLSGLRLTFELEGDGARFPDPGQPVALKLRPEAIELLMESPDQLGEQSDPNTGPGRDPQEIASHE